MDGDFRLGPWLVEPQRNLISAGDRRVRIEPKAMDVLAFLAGRARKVLHKETIISAVWPGVSVGDDVLTHAISELRKALGDDARRPQFIETIPKRGYRLICGVRVPVSTSQKGLGRFQGKRRGATMALAVLACAFAVVALIKYGAVSSRWESSPLQITAEVKRLTSKPGEERFPSLSPHGRSVIYTYQGDIYVQRAGGRSAMNLTEVLSLAPDLAIQPALSKDNRSLFFTRIRAQSDIWLMELKEP